MKKTFLRGEPCDSKISEEECQQRWWGTGKQTASNAVETAAQLKLKFRVKTKQGCNEKFMLIVVITKFSN